MFRHLSLPNNHNRNTKLQLDQSDIINMETIVKLQKQKSNPHEPTFLSKCQYEELCKTTYDGNVPFTITPIVEGVEEIKQEEIKQEETYVYKKTPVKRNKKDK